MDFRVVFLHDMQDIYTRIGIVLSKANVSDRKTEEKDRFHQG